jgi:MSHA pilin protein MshD
MGCKNPDRLPKSRGLTLIEVVASLGAATRSADTIGNRAIAAGLADELLSEIVQQAYIDPDSSSPVFGHESGESTTLRSAFDDVDDYNGWTSSPPKYRDGTTIPNRTNWRQTVAVTWVAPANPALASVSDQGAKRVRVTIEYLNQVLADRSAIRTNIDEK